MLPVQTVMIRYMVLVYRWGKGWLARWVIRRGFAGGAVTGGGARRRVLPVPGPGARGYAKAPPVWSRRGLKYEPYSAGFSSSLSLDLSNGFAGSLVSPELGSKR